MRRVLACVVLLFGCTREFIRLPQPQAVEQSAFGTLRLTGTLGDGSESTSITAQVSVKASFTDLSPDVVTYRLANEPSFAGAVFAPFPNDGVVAWTVAPGSGKKTVYAQLRTANETVAPTAAEIQLDDQAPVWASLTAPNAFFVEADQLSVGFDVNVADDMDGAVRLAFTQDAQNLRCEGEPLVPVSPRVTATLTPSRTLAEATGGACGSLMHAKRLPVYACAFDAAGNVSSRISFELCVITNSATTAPVAPVPLQGQPLQTGARITWSDNNALSQVVEVQYTTNDVWADDDPTFLGLAGSCVPRVTPAASAQVEGLQPGQRYHFRVRAIDCAGRASPWSATQVSVVVGRGELSFDDLFPGAKLKAIGTQLFLYTPVAASSAFDRRIHVGRCDVATSDCLDRASWQLASVQMPRHVATSAEQLSLFGDGETLYLAAPGQAELVLARCSRSNVCDIGSNWTSLSISTYPSATLESVAGDANARGFIIGYVAKKQNDCSEGTATLGYARCARMDANGCAYSGSWSVHGTRVTVDPQEPLTVKSNGDGLSIGYRTQTFSFGSGCATPDPQRANYAGLLRCEGDCETSLPSPLYCDIYNCGGAVTSTMFPAPGVWLPTGMVDAPSPGAFAPRFARAFDREFVAFESTVDPTGGLMQQGGKPLATVRFGVCDHPYNCSIGFSSEWSFPFTLGTRPINEIKGRLDVNVASGFSRATSELFVHWIDDQGRLLERRGSVELNAPLVTSELARDVPDNSGLSVALVGTNAFAMITRNFSPVLVGPLVATPVEVFVAPSLGGVAVSWRRPSTVTQMALTIDGSPLLLPATLNTERYVLQSTNPVAVAVSMKTPLGDSASSAVQHAVPFRVGETLRTLDDNAAASFAVVPALEVHPERQRAAVVVAGSVQTGTCTNSCDLAAQWAWTNIDPGYVWSSVDIASDHPRNWKSLNRLTGSNSRTWVVGHAGSFLRMVSCDDSVSSCDQGNNWTTWFAGASNTSIAPSISVQGELVMTSHVDTTNTLQIQTCDGLPASGSAAQPGECGYDLGTPANSTPGRSLYDNFACLHSALAAPAQRASNHCLNIGNWRTATLSSTAGRAKAAATFAHLPYGFLAFEGHTTGASFWSCAHSSWAGFPAPLNAVDCGNAANWTEVPLAALPSKAVDLIATFPHPDFTTASTQEGTAMVGASYADLAWRVALCYGAVDQQGFDKWPCRRVDAGSARGWTSVSLFATRSSPLASTLRVHDGNLVMLWQEAERMGMAVCQGGFNCDASESWRNTVIETSAYPVPHGGGQLLPAFGQLSVGVIKGQALSIYAGGRVY